MHSRRVLGIPVAGALLVAASSIGCGEPQTVGAPSQPADMTPTDPERHPAPSDGDPPPPADGDPAYSIPGFSWVTPQLAGLPKPGSSGELSRDLTFLAEQGVELVVSLTVTPLPGEAVREQGMTLEHVPIPDGTAPTPEQIDQFIALVVDAQGQGTKVAVHCLAGKGRTGTMLAAWFIHGGQTAEQAMAEIRSLRPGSIETSSQEQALHDYAQRVHGSGSTGTDAGT